MTSDLYVFDLETCVWARVTPSQQDAANVPGARYFHSCDTCECSESLFCFSFFSLHCRYSILLPFSGLFYPAVCVFFFANSVFTELGSTLLTNPKKPILHNPFNPAEYLFRYTIRRKSHIFSIKACALINHAMHTHPYTPICLAVSCRAMS